MSVSVQKLQGYVRAKPFSWYLLLFGCWLVLLRTAVYYLLIVIPYYQSGMSELAGSGSSAILSFKSTYFLSQTLGYRYAHWHVELALASTTLFLCLAVPIYYAIVAGLVLNWRSLTRAEKAFAIGTALLPVVTALSAPEHISSFYNHVLD